MAVDPETEGSVNLFNPRTGRWADHFGALDDLTIVGKTPVGRATMQLLSMNRPLAVEIRREEALRRRYPPKA